MSPSSLRRATLKNIPFLLLCLLCTTSNCRKVPHRPSCSLASCPHATAAPSPQYDNTPSGLKLVWYEAANCNDALAVAYNSDSVFPQKSGGAWKIGEQMDFWNTWADATDDPQRFKSLSLNTSLAPNEQIDFSVQADLDADGDNLGDGPNCGKFLGTIFGDGKRSPTVDSGPNTAGDKVCYSLESLGGADATGATCFRVIRN